MDFLFYMSVFAQDLDMREWRKSLQCILYSFFAAQRMSLRNNGRYTYRWTDRTGKRHAVYA
ncbi:MAG: integrase DNA-binding domain-containing protein, partial [Deltaproteobacteria bacterium]|nr:integrase DNA-binding domain-containing protein [Deltaproteobacteria bacterium]